MSLHRLVMTVAFAGWLAAAAPVSYGASNGRLIEGVDVEQVARLAAGVPLRFTVYGAPGASVALRIEGGWRVLALRETEPGIYEGTYVIDGRDAIGPASRVTATLQQGGALAHADLEQPLLRAEVPLPWADAAAKVASSQPQPADEPAPVVAVAPSHPVAPAPTQGAPVPIVAAAVPAAAPLPAPERLPPTTTRPLPAAAFPVVVARGRERALCDGCARVESVREVETRPGGAIGAVAGAIAGAVLGNELGEAHTRRMLRVLGAIGGAFAGREIERQATRRIEYEVVLRTADGGTQVRRYDRAPPFAPGATVRLDAPRGEPAPAPF